MVAAAAVLSNVVSMQKQKAAFTMKPSSEPTQRAERGRNQVRQMPLLFSSMAEGCVDDLQPEGDLVRLPDHTSESA